MMDYDIIIYFIFIFNRAWITYDVGVFCFLFFSLKILEVLRLLHNFYKTGEIITMYKWRVLFYPQFYTCIWWNCWMFGTRQIVSVYKHVRFLFIHSKRMFFIYQLFFYNDLYIYYNMIIYFLNDRMNMKTRSVDS